MQASVGEMDLLLEAATVLLRFRTCAPSLPTSPYDDVLSQHHAFTVSSDRWDWRTWIVCVKERQSCKFLNM